jgi:hypothetical protein
MPAGGDLHPRRRVIAGIQVNEFTVDIVAEIIFTDSIRWHFMADSKRHALHKLPG